MRVSKQMSNCVHLKFMQFSPSKRVHLGFILCGSSAMNSFWVAVISTLDSGYHQFWQRKLNILSIKIKRYAWILYIWSLLQLLTKLYYGYYMLVENVGSRQLPVRCQIYDSGTTWIFGSHYLNLGIANLVVALEHRFYAWKFRKYICRLGIYVLDKR